MGQLCSTPPKTNIKASVALSQEYKGVLFESINGDIIDAEAEAIINAANQQLIHNNGLGNSLLAKGGQTIQEESNKIKQEFEAEVPIGQAVVTSAGNLKAKYIIHVVSPIWNGGSNNEEVKLGECVTNALAQAEKHKLKSIAVPSLDGGVFGFPRESAARIIVEQCVQYINANQPTSIQNIKFINTNAVTVSAFKTAIQSSLLKAGGLNGESVHLAREDAVERETTTATEGEISTQEERVVRSSKPVEHQPVEQRPEVVETVSEEKKTEVPVPEAAIEQVAEKTVEQAIEQAVEQAVEEKQQEEAPAVVEQVIEEEKPVEEQPAVVEEQKPEEVVEQPAAVEEQAAVVEEQAAVVEEQAAVVEEQVAAVEEQKPEEVVEQPAAVEEKQQEEAPVVVEQPAEEEKPVEEQPAVVEEQKPEEVVEQPAAVEEQTTEEQPAVVEEEKTEEVAAETKTGETTETQETKETEAEEQGEAAAEEAQNEGEQGGKKKNKKKKGKRN